MQPGRASAPVLFGVLVGGAGSRMGGVAKGNLVLSGQSLLARALAACAAAASGSRAGADNIVLVGNSTAYPEASAGRLSDAPPGVGPLGGLRALLVEASARGLPAVALAVDMPCITSALLVRLVSEQPGAPAFAPREAGRWQPLFARYHPQVVLPLVDALLARSQTSPQSVFAALGEQARELLLDDRERGQLRDWDTPADVLSAAASPPGHANG